MYNIKIILFTKEEAIEFPQVKYYRVREGFFHIIKCDGTELYFNTDTVAFFDVRKTDGNVDADS